MIFSSFMDLPTGLMCGRYGLANTRQITLSSRLERSRVHVSCGKPGAFVTRFRGLAARACRPDLLTMMRCPSVALSDDGDSIRYVESNQLVHPNWMSAKYALTKVLMKLALSCAVPTMPWISTPISAKSP